jgi:hypothetical protein
MNKTKMKINRRKTNRNKTKKFKGGFSLSSLGSIFTFTEVSPKFKELLKMKSISVDIQNVYDSKKDQPKFNENMSKLKSKISEVNSLIGSVESEQKELVKTVVNANAPRAPNATKSPNATRVQNAPRAPNAAKLVQSPPQATKYPTPTQ